jgi:DNA-binding beta-propeller fold protein YncE
MRCVLSLAVFLSVPTFFITQASAQVPTATPDCCIPVATLVPLVGGFYRANGMATDQGRRRLFVADSGNDRVQVYTYPPQGAPTPGPLLTGIGFDIPSDLATDIQGNLYVANYGVANGRVWKFSFNGVSAAPLTEIGVGEVDHARGVFVDDGGAVYISAQNGQVYRYRSDGAGGYVLSGSFGSGFLDAPSDIHKDAALGLVYVANTGGNQVLSFQETCGGGNCVYSTPITLSFSGVTLVSPKAIDRDLAGNYYLVDSDNQFHVFAPDFTTLLRPSCGVGGTPAGVALDTMGRIFISTYVGNEVFQFPACFPQPTPTPGYFGADPPGLEECFVYPSPVRDAQATLSCRLARSGRIHLKIWNSDYRLVGEYQGVRPAGVQVLPFDASGFVTGVYFYSVLLEYGTGDKVWSRTGKFVVIH